MTILYGNPVKKEIEDKLILQKDKINKNKKIAILENTFDNSAKTYAKARRKLLEKFEIPFITKPIEEKESEASVVNLIKELNQDDEIAGIFIELPLPEGINQKKIFEYIDFNKDVEGVTTKTLGRLFINDETIAPPTAMSIIKILEYYNINLSGANTVIINRSLVIGKPLIALLLNRDSTVMVCHTKTKNIEDFIERADIVISGVAKAHFFKDKKLKRNAVVVDASINFENGIMMGDFDPEIFKDREDISYTPTPGGVGVVTNSIFLQNCIKLLSK